MEIKFYPCDIDSSQKSKDKKVNREIIEVLKNNNLSVAEAKIVFDEVEKELVCRPIS